jgi:hypothetical protein
MTYRFSGKLRAMLLATVVVGAGAPAGIAAQRSAPSGDIPLSLRISPHEYRNTITDVFGSDIVITGRFEPEKREEGLMAVGARSVNISADGVEQYDNLARGIAAQVVAPSRRDTLFPCKPQDITKSDDACARTFLSSSGRFLFRRPLTEDELSVRVRIAAEVANKKQDFYAGIAGVLSEMLLSPNFLYRIKKTEPDAAHPGRERLEAYSKAAVLSYYLWASTPDDMLLKAAESGELHTKEGVRRHVDRMVSSPNVENGVRAFFSDMFGFDEFETLSKDATFFPRFTPKVFEQAREQTLRTIVQHVVTEQGDYRDLFTTRKTFLTRPLAAVYNVPIMDRADNAQPDRWLPYEYPENDIRSGILSQISFVALHSPAGRSSPTLRGKALREYMMCQVVPPPPGNVDFAEVESASSNLKTARERLTAHATEAMCTGCHKITDPIGLALENFDSGGGLRTHENGALIDVSAELRGQKFEGPVGLAKIIREDPAITNCVAKRSFAFAAGRSPTEKDPAWREIDKRFKDSNFNILELMRQVAMSDILYQVPAQGSATEAAN